MPLESSSYTNAKGWQVLQLLGVAKGFLTSCPSTTTGTVRTATVRRMNTSWAPLDVGRSSSRRVSEPSCFWKVEGMHLFYLVSTRFLSMCGLQPTSWNPTEWSVYPTGDEGGEWCAVKMKKFSSLKYARKERSLLANLKDSMHMVSLASKGHYYTHQNHSQKWTYRSIGEPINIPVCSEIKSLWLCSCHKGGISAY